MLLGKIKIKVLPLCFLKQGKCFGLSLAGEDVHIQSLIFILGKPGRYKKKKNNGKKCCCFHLSYMGKGSMKAHVKESQLTRADSRWESASESPG